MDRDLIAKYARPVPRYTSFPTAPHFRATVGPADYAGWLEELPRSGTLSLYVHIPFCDSLCWFCGCRTKIVRRYDPVARYLRVVLTEIDYVARLVSKGRRVTHIHWGGGSPDILEPDDIRRLVDALRSRFVLSPGGEFAVEIDPRVMDEEKVQALTDAGMTRLSLGVQDFDPRVQAAINRVQSFEQTKRVVDIFRSRGLKSVNIDLVYGLPHQTEQGAVQTAEHVVSLDPERIALFGYAHLPQKIRHQRLIPSEAMPDIYGRFALAKLIGDHLVAAGYRRVGLDHFCKPGDSLAAGPLKRNFQGYTTDTAGALVGFGASAITTLPQGYVQNAIPSGEYQRRIGAGQLATARGIALSATDRAHGYAIERLMCDLRFPASELRQRFGRTGAVIAARAERFASRDQDGLVRPDPAGFRVTEKGRPFLRAICAAFDPYLCAGGTTHSIGV